MSYKKIKSLQEYFKYLDNPITALLFKFGLTKECEIKIKNSEEKINLQKIFSLNQLMRFLPLVSKKKLPEFVTYIRNMEDDVNVISINNVNYLNIYSSEFKNNHFREYGICIEEYFTDDQYNMINCKDRNIIDIGANAADATLQFAKLGANVIGFEPVKHLYDLGIENIKLNPVLENNIIFINKAVGGKKGILNIQTTSLNKSYIENSDSYDIEVITIEDILHDYNFPSDILKMDCEGCEFEIIFNSDLTMFNEIIFEHHSKIAKKDYKQLITILKEQGFTINTYPCNSCKLPFEDIGIIHAFK